MSAKRMKSRVNTFEVIAKARGNTRGEATRSIRSTANDKQESGEELGSGGEGALGDRRMAVKSCKSAGQPVNRLHTRRSNFVRWENQILLAVMIELEIHADSLLRREDL